MAAQATAQETRRLILITGAPSIPAQDLEQDEKPTEDLGGEDLTDEKMSKDLDEKAMVEEVDDPLLDDLDEDMEDLEMDDPPEQDMTVWSLKPITSLRAGLAGTSTKIPSDQSWQLTSRPLQPLGASGKVFAWAAPGIRYQPLLFEDVALERYGQTRGLYRQPFFSAAHYLKSALVLPYNSLIEPIDTCDYPLGYCRPGDPVPCVSQRVLLRTPRRR